MALIWWELGVIIRVALRIEVFILDGGTVFPCFLVKENMMSTYFVEYVNVIRTKYSHDMYDS